MGCFQTVEKASQSFLRKQKIKSKSFSAGACTWQKILLRLQVCELCAFGAQGVRAGDCKNLAESPEGDFRHAKSRPMGGFSVVCSLFFLGQICPD